MNPAQITEEGEIISRVIVQVAGKPKEHIIKVGDLMVKRIKSEKNLKVIQLDLSDVTEEEGMFTLFAEIEMKTKNIDHLAWFCFDYMPASVEIIEPREIRYGAQHLSNFFNEVQTRVHALDLALKTLTVENNKIKKNGSALIRNMLYYLTNKEPKSHQELSKVMGISEGELKPILDLLLEQKKMVKEGNNFKWVKRLL